VAETDTTPTEGTEDPSTEDTPEPTEGEGTEPPPESVDDLVSKLKAKSRESTKYQKRAQTAEAELTKFREAQLSEQEKAVKAARDEGFTEGRSLGDQRLIRAEVITAAAGKAADPNDVYALLLAGGALNDIEVDDNANVDTKSIAALVDALLTEKKHLAVGPTSRDPDFGARPAVTPAPNSDAAMDNWLRGEARR
jgi:hypothetical protein